MTKYKADRMKIVESKQNRLTRAFIVNFHLGLFDVAFGVSPVFPRGSVCAVCMFVWAGALE